MSNEALPLKFSSVLRALVKRTAFNLAILLLYVDLALILINWSMVL